MEERPLVKAVREKFSYYGVMSLLYGIIFTFCMYQNPNGITFLVIVIVTNVFAMQFVKKIGFKLQKDTWLYVAGMVLLGISSVRTMNGFIIFFNYVGIMLLFVVMMIHQFYRDKEWKFQTYVANLFSLFGRCVASIRYPFVHTVQKAVGDSAKSRKNIISICTGILIAFLMLTIIFPLLISSDTVFEMYFGRFVSNIHLGNAFWICVRIVVMTIVCYAFFCGLCEYSLKMNKKPENYHYNPLVAITFNSILAAVYLLYSGIQIVYLFAGIQRGLPEGVTYSSYARSGFWELIFVSLINFVMILICMHFFEVNRILKGILTIVSLCTFIMIGSAAYRMCMYVSAYHLSFLRVLVLWFLFLLTLIMAGTVYSIYSKKISLFHYIMVVTAICYILLSLARPDYYIAKYNVAHTQDMTGQEFHYLLYQLSGDAAGVLADMEIEQVMGKEYQEVAEEDLRGYFSAITYVEEDRDIRTWNYSVVQEQKAAERYLNRVGSGD